VTRCDGRGCFFFFINPNNKRKDFTIYSILASTVYGVVGGDVRAHCNTGVVDLWKTLPAFGKYAIRITLAEALVLFVDPVVARTKTIPPDAIPVVRWWQKHRQPGPQTFEGLVMPLLGKRELARIAEESLRDCTEAEREALIDHREMFEEHFLATGTLTQTWFLNEAELAEIGVTAESPEFDLIERWLKSEKLRQRYIQMAAHMRLFYTLGGEHPALADLWSMEVKIQTGLGRFLDSGLAFCIYSLTKKRIHRQNSSPHSGIERSWRFCRTPELEEKARAVLRGMGVLV
jgi:hypothetical protein